MLPCSLLSGYLPLGTTFAQQLLQALFQNRLQKAPFIIIIIIISLSYPLPGRVDSWTIKGGSQPWNVSFGAIGGYPRPRPCTVPYRTAPYSTVRTVPTHLGNS